MRVERRSVAAVAALAAIVLGAAGCGGSSGPASATLTDTGCAFDGDSTPPAGPYTVKLANQAAKDGSFAIGSIAQGSTVDDLEAFMAEQRHRIASGKTPAGPPAYYTENVTLSLPTGASSQMTGNLQAGTTYALICLTENVKGQPLTLYVASRLEVSG